MTKKIFFIGSGPFLSDAKSSSFNSNQEINIDCCPRNWAHLRIRTLSFLFIELRCEASSMNTPALGFNLTPNLEQSKHFSQTFDNFISKNVEWDQE